MYGATRSVVPPPQLLVHGRVFAETAVLGFDALSAASRATTVKEYVVFAESPPTVALGPVTVAVTAPPSRTSYPVTFTLSVEAVQARLTELEVVAVTCRLVGVLGGVLSIGPPEHEPPLIVQCAGIPVPLTRKPKLALAPLAM